MQTGFRPSKADDNAASIYMRSETGLAYTRQANIIRDGRGNVKGRFAVSREWIVQCGMHESVPYGALKLNCRAGACPRRFIAMCLRRGLCCLALPVADEARQQRLQPRNLRKRQCRTNSICGKADDTRPTMNVWIVHHPQQKRPSFVDGLFILIIRPYFPRRELPPLRERLPRLREQLPPPGAQRSFPRRSRQPC